MRAELPQSGERAERKCGDLLAGMEKHNGDPGTTMVPRLADFGLTKIQSSRWQKEAKPIAANGTNQHGGLDNINSKTTGGTSAEYLLGRLTDADD